MDAATLRLVQRAALVGLWQLFMNMFSESHYWEALYDRLQREKHIVLEEESLKAKWQLLVTLCDNGYCLLSWSITFRDESLGRFFVIFSDGLLSNAWWSNRAYRDGIFPKEKLDIETNCDPLDPERFAQLMSALSQELRRYIKRHKLPFRNAAARTLSQPPRTEGSS